MRVLFIVLLLGRFSFFFSLSFFIYNFVVVVVGVLFYFIYLFIFFEVFSRCSFAVSMRFRFLFGSVSVALSRIAAVCWSFIFDCDSCGIFQPF